MGFTGSLFVFNFKELNNVETKIRTGFCEQNEDEMDKLNFSNPQDINGCKSSFPHLFTLKQTDHCVFLSDFCVCVFQSQDD